MSIRIDTLTEQESIVVTTRGSVYELTVLRGDRGEVLVRGGSQFPEFRQACLLGSIADDGLFGPRTIGVGLRMKFVSGDVSVLTSPVRSFSLLSASPGTSAAHLSTNSAVSSGAGVSHRAGAGHQTGACIRG